MAESQVPFAYSSQTFGALRAAISTPRYTRYLILARQSETLAAALYLYNSRIAKAFLFPLNVFEVTLRNIINEALVALVGPDWHIDRPFVNNTLRGGGKKTLEKALNRAGVGANHDQIVATLTFDFWSNLLKPDYHPFLQSQFQAMFPHMVPGTTLVDVQSLVREVNDFRNRVAHHEPLLSSNINDIHAKIIRVVRWRTPEVADWLRHHSTVHMVTRTRPDVSGSATDNLASRCDRNFLIFSDQDTVAALLAAGSMSPAFVCVDDTGVPTYAFTAAALTACIGELAKPLDGCLDLNDHLVSEVRGAGQLEDRWQSLPDTASWADAIRLLVEHKPSVLVATEYGTGKPTGVVVRSHRRY